MLCCVIEESVGRAPTERGTYPATLRVLISGQEYADLRAAGASLRAPLRLPENAGLLPPAVADSLRTWMRVRSAVFAAASEPQPQQFERLSATALDLAVYSGRSFAARRPTGTGAATGGGGGGGAGADGTDLRAMFIVGDAAFGVPFFRALNNGLLCATELAACVAEELRGGPATAEPAAPVWPLHEKEAAAAAAAAAAVAAADTNAGDGGARIGDGVGSYFARIGASLSASAGLSAHLAEASGRGASQALAGALSPPAADPVLRYHDYVRRLAEREIAVARAKRDGLALVRLEHSLYRTRAALRRGVADKVKASVAPVAAFLSGGTGGGFSKTLEKLKQRPQFLEHVMLPRGWELEAVPF